MKRSPASRRPAAAESPSAAALPQSDRKDAADAPSDRESIPVFRALERRECEAILARSHVGRLAFSFHDRVDIEPIHYVYDGEWLFGRTSLGSKLVTLQHSRWVALEVDEVEGVFDWRSVVVHGAFYVISPEGDERQARAWERGVELLRRIVPETGSGRDPVPFRTVVFRVYIDAVTGREASTRAAASAGEAAGRPRKGQDPVRKPPDRRSEITDSP